MEENKTKIKKDLFRFLRLRKSDSKNAGITLIALIITIIVLLILAAVTINMVLGENGLYNKSTSSVEKYNKQAAIERINLKLMEIHMDSYEKYGRVANLQEIADQLCDDDEIEYVLKQSKATAGLTKIDVSDVSSIFTKLKEYPYEFEVGKSGKIETIDGEVYISNTGKKTTQTKSTIKPKIGDYVTYSSKLIGKESITTSIETDTSKTGTNSKQAFKTDTSKEWRVIDVDEENDIVKIVATSNVYDINGSGLVLDKEAGFVNGEDILNDLCDDLYSTNYGTAKNISVNDLNKLNNFTDPTSGDVSGSSAYGTVTSWSSHVEYDQVNNIFYTHSNWPICSLTWTQYGYTPEESMPLYDDLIYNASNNTVHNYWLSSRCVAGVNGMASEMRFSMMLVKQRKIDSTYVAKYNNSRGAWDYYAPSYGLRPIVSLNAHTEFTEVSNNVWEI